MFVFREKKSIHCRWLNLPIMKVYRLRFPGQFLVLVSIAQKPTHHWADAWASASLERRLLNGEIDDRALSDAAGGGLNGYLRTSYWGAGDCIAGVGAACDES